MSGELEGIIDQGTAYFVKGNCFTRVFSDYFNMGITGKKSS
jgi:hypothetical protein